MKLHALTMLLLTAAAPLSYSPMPHPVKSEMDGVLDKLGEQLKAADDLVTRLRLVSKLKTDPVALDELREATMVLQATLDRLHKAIERKPGP